MNRSKTNRHTNDLTEEERWRKAQDFVRFGKVFKAELKGQVIEFSVREHGCRDRRVFRENGRTRCSCLDFVLYQSEPEFRCEHIIAVNLFLRGLKPDQPPVSTNQISNTEAIYQNMSNHQSNKNIQKRESGLSSYSEAKTFEEALQMFNRETPSGLILDIPRRNSKGDDYIEWHTVAEILDIVFPRWTHSIKEIKQIEKFVSVTVVITIDGVSREGMGTGEATSELGIKKAEHDALKRAAVKFGIARDLRVKDEDSHPAFKNQNNQNNRNNNSSNSYQGNNSNRNQANNSASQNNFPSNVSQINPKLATNDQLQELVKLQREINTQFDKKLFAPDEFMNRFKTTAGGQGVPRTVTRQQVEEVTRDFQMIKQSCLKEAAKLQEKAG